jgi:hypothetical protein
MSLIKRYTINISFIVIIIKKKNKKIIKKIKDLKVKNDKIHLNFIVIFNRWDVSK